MGVIRSHKVVTFAPRIERKKFASNKKKIPRALRAGGAGFLPLNPTGSCRYLLAA
jgi:hypothetical protein